uniref:Uncharacterized protein n=1 Tax=Magnetococcus massalia (strain MO-1) TaxID=451514 RepID=A0A1S7LHX2_MAGMO|nr:protein of unknown function[Include TPR repeats] [Candidatus Magnetococcus massalia]
MSQKQEQFATLLTSHRDGLYKQLVQMKEEDASRIGFSQELGDLNFALSDIPQTYQRYQLMVEQIIDGMAQGDAAFFKGAIDGLKADDIDTTMQQLMELEEKSEEQPLKSQIAFIQGLVTEAVLHLSLALGHFERAIAQNPDELEWLHRAAALASRLHQKEPSIQWAKQAVELAKKAHGPQSVEAAKQLNLLANCLGRTGELAEATEQHKAIEEILKQQGGDEPLLMAETLTNLGQLYQKQEMLEAAERSFNQALEIYRNQPAASPLAMASCLRGLGILSGRLERADQAEENFIEALDLRKQALGEKHPEVGDLFNDLGVVYRHQQRFAEAVEMFRADMEISRESLGERHPSIADSLLNIAGLYHQQGKLDETEKTLIEAGALYQATLGPGHPFVGQTLAQLGELKLREMGDSEQGCRLLVLARDIYQKSLPAEHPEKMRLELLVQQLCPEAAAEAEAAAAQQELNPDIP